MPLSACTIGLMLLSTLSVYVLIGPRVVFAMAKAGQFPAVAARLDPAGRDARCGDRASDRCRPRPAVDGHAGKHHRLRRCRPFDLLDAGDELDLCLAVAAPRPAYGRFRTPGYPVTPAVYLFLTGLLTLATFHDRPQVSAYALLSILAGIPFYYVWQAKGRLLDALRRISKLIK